MYVVRSLTIRQLNKLPSYTNLPLYNSDVAPELSPLKRQGIFFFHEPFYTYATGKSRRTAKTKRGGDTEVPCQSDHNQQGFVPIGLCIRQAETPAAYTANR